MEHGSNYTKVPY